MTPQDAETIIAIAALAAQADGQQSDAERAQIQEMAAGLGLSDPTLVMASGMPTAVGDTTTLSTLAARLTDVTVRQTAYDTASSVCYADGWLNPSETAFLRTLAAVLTIDPAQSDAAAASVHEMAAPVVAPPAAAAASALDQYILDQAMLSAALELLPDRLANLGILPLQLRMAHQIGARHGQQMNASQVRDLAAVFGIGAAAQILEKVVRTALGGFAGILGRGALGSLLGGVASNAVGVAAGASVTFATTYALGHAADQYYTQGRSLSTADMKTLFERFREDATTIFPKVEARVRELASTGNVGSLLRSAPR